MSAAQHTKLRVVAEDDFWSAAHDGRGTSAYQVIKDDSGTVLALAVGHHPDPFNGQPTLDHAHRLVACWNAFDGLGTNQIESMVNVPEFFFKHMALMEQRDELLHTLLLALPYVEDAQADPCYKPGAVATVVRQMRAAIAQADPSAGVTA